MRKVHSPFTRGHDHKEVYVHKVDPETGKKFERVSHTVPDQSLKVKDIIQRYIKKQPMPELNMQQTPVWSGEDMTHDSPDLNKMRDMDRMEKMDLAKSFKPIMKPEKVEKKLTRAEYDAMKETKLTFDEWDKIPAAEPKPAA